MDKVDLSDLRDRLNAVNLELAGSHFTSREIVREFRNRERELVAKANDEILDIGLIQLLNRVSNRRPSAVAPGQIDLFAGHNDFPAVVVVPVTGVDGRRRDERKKFIDMTYSEALAWLEAHIRKRENEDEQLLDARQVIDRAAPHIKSSPAKTIADGLKAALDAELVELGIEAPKELELT